MWIEGVGLRGRQLGNLRGEQRHLMGPWDPGPGTQIVPDPGPVKCLEGTRTLGTQMTGPECWDPNFWDPSVGTLRPGTQMKGPK